MYFVSILHALDGWIAIHNDLNLYSVTFTAGQEVAPEVDPPPGQVQGHHRAQGRVPDHDLDLDPDPDPGAEVSLNTIVSPYVYICPIKMV